MGHARKQTLVELALVEFVDRVDASDGCDVLEYHLVGTDAHDWAVFLKQAVIGHALLEPENVGGHPEIGRGRVPGAGYRTQGRQEEVVYGARDGIEKDEGDEEGGDVVGYPRKRGSPWCVHSDGGDARTGRSREWWTGDFYKSCSGCDKNIS